MSRFVTWSADVGTKVGTDIAPPAIAPPAVARATTPTRTTTVRREGRRRRARGSMNSPPAGSCGSLSPCLRWYAGNCSGGLRTALDRPSFGDDRHHRPMRVWNWLARKDSNLRSSGPEPDALPLGHSPVSNDPSLPRWVELLVDESLGQEELDLVATRPDDALRAEVVEDPHDDLADRSDRLRQPLLADVRDEAVVAALFGGQIEEMTG